MIVIIITIIPQPSWPPRFTDSQALSERERHTRQPNFYHYTHTHTLTIHRHLRISMHNYSYITYTHTHTVPLPTKHISTCTYIICRERCRHTRRSSLHMCIYNYVYIYIYIYISRTIYYYLYNVYM